jgi:hypothetical protein
MVARQLIEACGWEWTPGYIIRDRDGVYGEFFTRRLRAVFQIHIFARRHNYAALQQNQHNTGASLSHCQGGFVWVQLIHVPSASAAIDE